MNWSIIKGFATGRNIPLQYIDNGSSYLIKVFDDAFQLEYSMLKDAGADQVDFETNFKPSANVKLSKQSDTDGALFVRSKEAPTGWTYQIRGVEFTTSLLNSLVNNDSNNVAVGDTTITFYDTTGAVVTLATAQSSIVKTVVDIEPKYDLYIIGGTLKILATPANPVRVSVITAPDITYASGGSRILIQNINFKYVTASDKIIADNRTSAFLPYNATTHSNKIRLIVYHNAGEQDSITFFLESYKV